MSFKNIQSWNPPKSCNQFQLMCKNFHIIDNWVILANNPRKFHRDSTYFRHYRSLRVQQSTVLHVFDYNVFKTRLCNWFYVQQRDKTTQKLYTCENLTVLACSISDDCFFYARKEFRTGLITFHIIGKGNNWSWARLFRPPYNTQRWQSFVEVQK